jgi:hypothetical protein
MQSKEVPGSVISYLYVLLQMFQWGYLKNMHLQWEINTYQGFIFGNGAKSGEKGIIAHESEKVYTCRLQIP